MSKKHKQNKSKLSQAKEYGRSHGALVKDTVLGDMVTPKVLAARKKNNPKRYEN